MEDVPPGPGSLSELGRHARRVQHRVLAVAAVLVAIASTVAVLRSTGGDTSLRAAGGDGAAATKTSEAGATLAPDPTIAAGPPATTVRPSATATPAGGSAPLPPATTAAVTGPTATTATFRPGGRVQVKFVEGSGARVRDGRFVSVSGGDLTAVANVLVRYPGTLIERLFSRPEEELAAEKAAVEASSGRPQADLNLYYRLTLAAGADINTAIADLSRLAVVERAYADPGAAPPPGPSPGP